MSTYEVDIGGTTYEVDAPDERTAWSWANATHSSGGPAQPMKIGREAFADALRKTLREESWASRNLAGAGTAISNLWQRAKQLAGQGNPGAIEANRIIAEEAPVGAIAGNAALFAPTAMVPGLNSYTGAALTGAAIGALQPTSGGTLGEHARETAINMGAGGAGGVGGQFLGGLAGRGMAAARNAAAIRASQNAPRDATLAAAHEAGYVVPPSMADSGIGSRLLEAASGKYKTNQLAGVKNQQVTDALARQAVGLPKDAPLTSEAMQAIRRQAYQAGYAPVANVGAIPTDTGFSRALNVIANKYRSPARSFPNAIKDDISTLVDQYRVGGFEAEDAIRAIQVLRDDAASAFRSGNPGLAKASKEIAGALEDQIERGLVQSGAKGAELLKGFKEARVLMAKAHTVEDAIVEGGGHVNAMKLAQRLQAGKPLSGELETVGKFANVFRDVAKVPASGHPNPLTIIDLGYGGLGLGISNPYMAALPAVRVASRYSLLSHPYQRAFVGPDYSPPTTLRLADLLRPFAPGAVAGGAVEALNQ